MTENIADRIRSLKEEKNAVILAHSYTRPEVQDIADVVGDSLGLSRAAVEMDAEIIVFAGVHFMAESAAILSPEKKVLLPAPDAGCPMADMITAEALRAAKKKYPGACVVCYVNSSAAVKAESDVCCTSANAAEVVNAVESDEILFVPDRNLGRYVAGLTDKTVHLWDGFCPVHDAFGTADVEAAKKVHPNAVFPAHPECRSEVLSRADGVFSTAGIFGFVGKSTAEEFIIGTENGVLPCLRQENPGKRFYPLSEKALCPNMKKPTLANILKVLETEENVVSVPEDIRVKAEKALNRMLEILPSK